MNDPVVATVAQIVGGIVVALFAALVGTLPWLRARSSRPARSDSESRAYTASRGQIVVEGNATGLIEYRDQSINVTQNIDASLEHVQRDSSSSDSSEWGYIILIGIAAVIAATLFSIYNQWVLVASIALGVGVTSSLVVTMIRTNHRGSWNSRTITAAARVIVSLIAAGVAWVMIYSTTQLGFNLPSMQSVVERATPTDSSPGVAGILDNVVVYPVKEFMSRYGFPGVMFVLVLMAGIVFAVILLLLAWDLLFNWNAYLRLEDGEAKPHAAKRAKAFQNEGKGWMVALPLAVAMAIVFSSGIAFAGWNAIANHGTTPLAISTTSSSPAPIP